ncbi:MAG: hypothetical protein K2W82_01450 [Candidatus Obscuribacterales bacterium]|nr:hypothetical protein [Candidatus Obscuribacterales bacterium]
MADGADNSQPFRLNAGDASFELSTEVFQERPSFEQPFSAGLKINDSLFSFEQSEEGFSFSSHNFPDNSTFGITRTEDGVNLGWQNQSSRFAFTQNDDASLSVDFYNDTTGSALTVEQRADGMLSLDLNSVPYDTGIQFQSRNGQFYLALQNPLFNGGFTVNDQPFGKEIALNTMFTGPIQCGLSNSGQLRLGENIGDLGKQLFSPYKDAVGKMKETDFGLFAEGNLFASGTYRGSLTPGVAHLQFNAAARGWQFEGEVGARMAVPNLVKNWDAIATLKHNPFQQIDARFNAKTVDGMTVVEARYQEDHGLISISRNLGEGRSFTIAGDTKGGGLLQATDGPNLLQVWHDRKDDRSGALLTHEVAPGKRAGVVIQAGGDRDKPEVQAVFEAGALNELFLR